MKYSSLLLPILLMTTITQAEKRSLDDLVAQEKALSTELAEVRNQIAQQKNQAIADNIDKATLLNLNQFVMSLAQPAKQYSQLKTTVQKTLFTEKTCERIKAGIDGRKTAVKIAIKDVRANEDGAQIFFIEHAALPCLKERGLLPGLHIHLSNWFNIDLSKQEAAQLQPDKALTLIGTVNYLPTAGTQTDGYRLMSLQFISGYTGNLGSIVLEDATVHLDGKTYKL